MGLGNWFNRYILEVKQGEQAPAPKADDPPEVQAKAVELVPTRPASEVITNLPQTDFSSLAPQLEETVVKSEPEPEPKAEPEAEPAPPSKPAKPQRDPMDDGKPPPVSIEQVYAVAKLGKPEHGFTLEKISGMLTDERMAAMDEVSRANAIAVVLDMQGVKIIQIVQDAAERDVALDRFEGFLTDKLITLEVEIDEKNAEVEAEIERFVARKREEIARSKERLVKKERELARFRRVKRGEEERLYDVVRHFTSENPISVTELGGGGEPSTPPADPAPKSPGAAAEPDDGPSYKDIAAQLRESRVDES